MNESLLGPHVGSLLGSRAGLIAECRTPPENWRLASITRDFHKLYPLVARAGHEAAAEHSVAGIAAASDRTPEGMATI